MKIAQRTVIDENRAKELAKSLDVNLFTAKLLLCRGQDENTAQKYLFGKLSDLTDPYAYRGMGEAVELIRSHLNKKSKIVVYGDYDCDGIGATAILTRAFADHGYLIDHYVPVRADEGYGLNCDAIRKIRSEKNADLIITVDCGIASAQEVDLCKKLGMDVIVTDHHRPGDDLPDCILVDPCLDPDLTQLCGAGVAYYLVRAMFGEEDAKMYLDICALSTIADIVPLVDDNRILVKYGLELIRMGYAKVGIKALIESAGILQRYVSSGDVSFKIAPRINASGRLATAENAIKALTTDDPTEARLIAQELSLQNDERKQIESAIVDDAMEKMKNYDLGKYKIIVLCDEKWEAGVNGIAAAKLTEYFHLPTILLTKTSDGTLKGSARSIPGVNIYDAIVSQRGLLTSFGGHPMAAGLILPENRLSEFREGINREICKKTDDLFEKVFYYDIEFSMYDVSSNIVKILKYFEPFGFGNNTPVFYDPSPSVKFNELKGKHLKGKTTIGDVVAFSYGPMGKAYNKAEKKSLLYTVDKNIFNGYVSDQLRVKGLFMDRFEVDQEELLIRFYDFSVQIGKKKAESVMQKNSEKPAVYVFFAKDLFDEFVRKNPDVATTYAITDTFLPGRVAVLSPDPDFPFAYYSKIIVHGKMPNTVEKYFLQYNASFCNEDVILKTPEIDVKEMRNTYVEIVKNFKGNDFRKFFTLQEIYDFLQKRGYIYPFDRFALHFYILLDVKLLKWENGAILLSEGKKVDLSTSSLYAYAYGTSTQG